MFEFSRAIDLDQPNLFTSTMPNADRFSLPSALVDRISKGLEYSKKSTISAVNTEFTLEGLDSGGGGPLVRIHSIVPWPVNA